MNISAASIGRFAIFIFCLFFASTCIAFVPSAALGWPDTVTFQLTDENGAYAQSKGHREYDHSASHVDKITVKESSASDGEDTLKIYNRVAAAFTIFALMIGILYVLFKKRR